MPKILFSVEFQFSWFQPVIQQVILMSGYFTDFILSTRQLYICQVNYQIYNQINKKIYKRVCKQFPIQPSVFPT